MQRHQGFLVFFRCCGHPRIHTRFHFQYDCARVDKGFVRAQFKTDSRLEFLEAIPVPQSLIEKFRSIPFAIRVVEEDLFGLANHASFVKRWLRPTIHFYAIRQKYRWLDFEEVIACLEASYAVGLRYPHECGTRSN